jgi:RNA polymerase sigma factor (sigma-70 family)
MEVESARPAAADVADDAEATALRARDDRTAFAALYVRHREAVYRYLRARCANDEDALELTAMTFERALAAMPRYSSRAGGVVAWLLRIARNAVIDEERKRRPLVPQWKVPEAASADATPEDAAIGAGFARPHIMRAWPFPTTRPCANEDDSGVTNRYVRFDRSAFVRLLTADPPVCRGGRPLEVLANCDRMRRGEPCWCRFEAETIADDLDAIAASDLSEWLTDTLEPEDVETFADDLERAVNVARAKSFDDDAVQRVVHLHTGLRRLVRAGAGLTDRHSDDLD